MADREILVDRGGGSRESNGVWSAVAIVVLILLVLFLLFGGLNIFTNNQGGTQTDDGTNNPTPTVPAPTTESPAPTTETTPAPTTPTTDQPTTGQ